MLRPIQIRRCHDFELVLQLKAQLFADLWLSKEMEHWVFWADDEPLGFASSMYYSQPKCVFLSGCGVLPKARGNGLQARSIRVRERRAKELGYYRMISYTAHNNAHSANNLIKCGYRVYTPPASWGIPYAIYFEKRLPKTLVAAY